MPRIGNGARTPAAVRILGEEIAVRHASSHDIRDDHGYWDPELREIVLCDGMTSAEAVIVYVHEALHVAEDRLCEIGVMSRRASHAYVTGAAVAVVQALAGAGLLRGVSEADLAKFARERSGDHDGLEYLKKIA